MPSKKGVTLLSRLLFSFFLREVKTQDNLTKLCIAITKRIINTCRNIYEEIIKIAFWWNFLEKCDKMWQKMLNFDFTYFYLREENKEVFKLKLCRNIT